MSYRFVWKLTYGSVAEFEVHGDGPCYRIEERREPSAYDLEMWPHSIDQWNREVVGSVGTIHRRDNQCKAVPQAVVDAFNAWKMAEWERYVERVLADLRYAGAGRNEFKPPPVVRGAVWQPSGSCWIVQPAASMERAA